MVAIAVEEKKKRQIRVCWPVNWGFPARQLEDLNRESQGKRKNPPLKSKEDRKEVESFQAYLSDFPTK